MPIEAVQIVFLVDYPEHLPKVAEWIFGEWGTASPGLTLEKTEVNFRNYLQRDALPLTLVALRDEKPVGTASLQPEDMTTRPELTPWLACVYVPLEERGKGIGSNVVAAAEGSARRLKIPALYLFTPDKEKFYSRLGWSLLEHTDYRNRNVVVMRKWFADLAEPF
jgi:predicted N-acetyltransferase YhbS